MLERNYLIRLCIVYLWHHQWISYKTTTWLVQLLSCLSSKYQKILQRVSRPLFYIYLLVWEILNSARKFLRTILHWNLIDPACAIFFVNSWVFWMTLSLHNGLRQLAITWSVLYVYASDWTMMRWNFKLATIMSAMLSSLYVLVAPYSYPCFLDIGSIFSQCSYFLKVQYGTI